MKPILAVMVGVSGSGKSTYAQGLVTSLTLENSLPTVVVETDAIRKELTGNASDQTQNSRVFSIANKRVSTAIAVGKNVIIDATSLTKRDRKEWITIGNEWKADVRAYFINTNVDKSKRQNRSRDRVVPDDVIDRQKSKLVPPTESEGFSKVVVV